MAKPGPKGPSKYTPAFIEAQAEALILYAEKAERPLLQEYASIQRIPDEGLFSKWANPSFDTYNERFYQAYKTFKQIQYTKWLHLAAIGEIPPAVFIFFAKNVLGMRDEQYLETKNTEEKNINLSLAGLTADDLRAVVAESRRRAVSQGTPRISQVGEAIHQD